MQVMPFFHTQSNTYTYVISDPQTQMAAVLDPCLDFEARSGRTSVDSAQALLDYLESAGLQLQWILETHAHADHLSAGRWLKSHRPQALLAIGQGICQVQSTFKPVFNLGPDFATDGRQFDRLFADGDVFAIGELEVKVLATPGHTNDSVSYHVGDALFVGDTLFMPDGGSARCDFPGGSAARLYQSIQRLYALADSTRVFVCHDYGPNDREFRCQSTIAEQKAANIHLRTDITQAEFVRIREARDATLGMPALILPSIQVNIRAGELPAPESNGVRYLKLPLDQF